MITIFMTKKINILKND